jgi:hypothetical protein
MNLLWLQVITEKSNYTSRGEPSSIYNITKVLPTHWQNACHDGNRWTEILAVLQIIQVQTPLIHNSPDSHMYIYAATAILDTSSKAGLQ